MILLLLAAVAPCSGDSDVNDTRVKLLENYVISANFDENTALPQLQGRPPPELESRIINLHPQRDKEEELGLDATTALLSGERDLPPGGVVTPQSLLAVGFITFLILLTSLQNSMTMIRHSTLLETLGLTRPGVHARVVHRAPHTLS